MNYHWQTVMEKAWRGYSPRYLWLQDAQGPLAIAVANATQSFGRTGQSGRLLQRLTLALSAPFSATHCGVMTRPGTSLTTVLPHLDRALSQLAWREKRPLLGISNVSDGDLSIWQARHFLASARPAAAVLELPADYDQYLGSLLRKDRKELRRMRRRALENGASFDCGPLGGDERQLYALLCEVFASHGTLADKMPITAEIFATLEQEMGDQIIVFRGFVNNELAAMYLGLHNEQTLWMPLVGLRYELARPTFLYFLLVDEAIRWCFKQGIQRIYGGLTSEREKKRQGFDFQNRWFCYRLNPSLLNPILRLILSLSATSKRILRS